MNDTKNIPLDYVNGLIYELEKAFWDERGRGARFRMTIVGQEYYQDRVRSLLKSSELEHILKTVQEVFKMYLETGYTIMILSNSDEGCLRALDYLQDKPLK